MGGEGGMRHRRKHFCGGMMQLVLETVLYLHGIGPERWRDHSAALSV